MKPHIENYVALDIDPGRDLYQLESLRSDAEHGALGYEKRELRRLTAHARVVANLFELPQELLVAALFADDGLAIVPRDVEIARGQRAAEDHALRVLGDVMNPPTPMILSPKRLTLTLPSASTSAKDRNARSRPPPS